MVDKLPMTDFKPERDALHVTLKLDFEELTKQRAALLAATHDDDEHPLNGVLYLLDFISDEAQEAGLLTGEDRTRWWREGCIAAGLGDPGEPCD